MVTYFVINLVTVEEVVELLAEGREFGPEGAGASSGEFHNSVNWCVVGLKKRKKEIQDAQRVDLFIYPKFSQPLGEVPYTFKYTETPN